MSDEVSEATDCMIAVAFSLVVVAIAVLVGHFFGFAFGLVAALVLTAAFVLWLALGYYMANKRGDDA